VVVPCFPGALSALGILMSDIVRDYSKTVMLPVDAPGLETHFAELETRGQKEMQAEGLRATSLRSLDIRYTGQGYELNVPAGANVASRFHAAHQQRYGYSDERRPIEIVNLRVRVAASTKPIEFPRRKLSRGDGRHAIVKKRAVYFDGRTHQAAVYDRARLTPGDSFTGPAIVIEYSATSVIPPECRAHVDAWENLIVEVNPAGAHDAATPKRQR
jgi:N-methylhydantoinase A